MNRTIFILSFLSIFLFSCNDDQRPQSEIDEELILQYIDDNDLTMQRHSSGLYYHINNIGNGANPNYSSRVSVEYKGYLMDGTVFDSGEIEGYLSSFITGWQIGVPLIKPGGEIKIIIPSGLGYGSRTIGEIPANSVLIFDVNLIAFK